MAIQPPYFVVMQDYGRRGREAVVDPELTRADVINRIGSGEYQDILFIHQVEDGLANDVTDELMSLAMDAQEAAQ